MSNSWNDLANERATRQQPSRRAVKNDCNGLERAPLLEHWRSSLERLVRFFDELGYAPDLRGIGLVTTEAVGFVGAFFLIRGDLPPEAEPYRVFSPVEWSRSTEEPFADLNGYLAAAAPPPHESDADYEARVRRVFDTCAEAIEASGIRDRFGPDLYLTFTGVDLNDVLEDAEARFVERVNSSKLHSEWREH